MKVIVLFFFLSFSFFDTEEAIWYSDFEEVKKIASSERKEIIMVFSGSDWCRPCIVFDQEVLSNRVFQDHISLDYVLLKLDFPTLKKNKLSADQQRHNESLAATYNKQGEFPKVLLMDATGKVLKQLDYVAGTGPEVFLSQM